MNSTRILGIILIIGGALGLAFGGFNFTKETHSTDIGPIHLQMDQKEHVNIPLWAGIGALIGGVVLLAVSRKT